MNLPSFRLSRLVSLALCSALVGCGYFIPPDKSVPRYNSVNGDARRPELNPAPGQAPVPTPESDASPALTGMPQVAQAPAMPPMPAYPAVSPETQARADAMMANPAPAPIASSESIARRVPEENATASNNSYPPLNSVPPASSVDHDAAARLARVRAQLEQERNSANTDKNQLVRDAAAEPSLMPAANTGAPVPVSAVAPPDPIVSAPIAPPVETNPAPMAASAPVITPPPPAATPIRPAPVPSSYISSSLPPPPPALNASMPPAPESLGSIPVATAPSSVTYYPPAAPVQEPIVLRAPQQPANTANAAPFSTPSYVTPMSSTQAMPQAAAGGFNPLDGASSTASSTSNIYSSSGYLPASRYANRHY